MTPLIITLAALLSAGGLGGRIMDSELPNGSFEALSNGTPEHWRKQVWAGPADLSVSGEARDGERCVAVRSAEGADAAWVTIATVMPFSRYRLSAWVRTEGVTPIDGQGALVNLHTRPERTRALVGDNDWTELSMEFDTDADETIQINCILGYFGRAKGTAWFDDVRLVRLSSRQLSPSVTIDAAKRGEPISKYIYGQFIEHLGRCIYGGIWAEMLEDRKFCLPVGDRESPWRSVGGAAVTMDRNEPFVGDHTPLVRLPGKDAAGLSQGGLTVVSGRRYMGRIWLRGDATVAPIRVSLVWGDEPEQRDTVDIKRLGPNYEKYPLKFSSHGDSAAARLEILSSGSGSFHVGCVSLMPEDNVRGMRRDTLRLLKELNAPIYRWPGGNFVSGYDWREGIGDPDKRPPRRNPAWSGLEHNDFGTHEFLDFCHEIGAEPLIVVNTGFGDANSAAEWVEYVNGAPDTPMGRLRAANGRKEPWGVVWWGIGNEMYGNWQLGHMALGQYVVKHNEVVKKMRAVDPAIKTIGVGAVGEWSKQMLTHCADSMDLISEHFYCGAKVGVMSHVAQIRDNVRAKAVAHREYREQLPSLRGKDIRIAMDEWNYWYGPDVFGEIGTRYFHKDALGIAVGLHEFFRNTDIIAMANYAQTVNVIGAIKTTPTAAAFDTTGLVLKLYRQHYGAIPLLLEGTMEPLDVAAALTEDGKRLTLAVVNATGQPRSLRLEWKGLEVVAGGVRYTMRHDDPMAYNEPGVEPRVFVVEEKVDRPGSSIEVPSYSIVLYVLPVTVR